MHLILNIYSINVFDILPLGYTSLKKLFDLRLSKLIDNIFDGIRNKELLKIILRQLKALTNGSRIYRLFTSHRCYIYRHTHIPYKKYKNNIHLLQVN